MSRIRFPDHPILLVDDDEHVLAGLEIALRAIGITNTILCRDSREVERILAQQKIGIILLDLLMPSLSGEEVLGRIKQDYPDISVIMVTGVNEVDTAVRCIKQGAFDYLLKPVARDHLETSLRRALEVDRLRRENARLARHLLKGHPTCPEAFNNIITASPAMRSIFQYCAAIAEGSEPVLITGETGVGKELFADAVHTASKRKGAIVGVNAAGLDENVFADALFGHKKGAFTGADQARGGLIEKAVGGTLFLDEIGDLSEVSQVKLLRLLQEREYFPVGSDVSKPADARIVLATNKNLDELLQAGRFRKDLYYRLRTHHVHIPPLRDRKEDIPLLLDYFLGEAAGKFGKKKPACPPMLPKLLMTYHFPGNVRELRAMAYDAMARHTSRALSLDAFKASLSPDVIPATDFAESPSSNTDNSWGTQSPRIPSLKEATGTLVHEAMKRANNNQRLAATMLGISRQALNKRLKRSTRS
jgi:DNA-binding NtrC family response regulator